MHAKDLARRRLEEIEPVLYDLSRWLYEHPETALEEHASAERVAETLAASGLRVEAPVFGLPTAFAAHAGSSGPRVVICAEYDALPGVGHACGHNIIAAAAVGAGHALAPLCEELGFRLTVLGTPAEERHGGKVDLIDAGAFADVAAVVMIHPAVGDVVDPHMVAVTHLEVSYQGRAAHAAAHPQLGINALDAFVQAYVNISTLRQQLSPTDKVHGIITAGGDAPNIIPAHTRSSWYVRATTRDRLDDLIPRVRACFEAAAIATGCEVEITSAGHVYDELVSHPLLADLFAENVAALGRPMRRGAETDPAGAVSSDIGNVSQLVPTIHPMLDIGSYPAVNHQPAFADHTVTPDGERTIHDGALAMAWTVIDLVERRLWDRL